MDTFICAKCGEEYIKDWTDEEAEQEKNENFGENIPLENCAIVCDDCYKKFMKGLLN